MIYFRAVVAAADERSSVSVEKKRRQHNGGKGSDNVCVILNFPHSQQTLLKPRKGAVKFGEKFSFVP